MKIKTRTLRFIEFAFVGVVMGLLEDLLAVFLSTGEPITPKIFVVVFAVALPFAFISEYIVDHPRFWKRVFRLEKSDEGE